MEQAPAHVYEIFIRTTPERLWQALTDPALTQQYLFFGSRYESDWQPGSAYIVSNANGNVVEGEILEIDPPRRLVMTWRATFADIPVTTVTWMIEPIGDSCKLTLQHSGLEPGSPVTQGLGAAWTQIISSLKSLLETGQPLRLEQ